MDAKGAQALKDYIELAQLRKRIREGCRNADDDALVMMLTNRRNALARQQEMEMPRTIIERQEIMIAETVKVVRERGLLA